MRRVRARLAYALIAGAAVAACPKRQLPLDVFHRRALADSLVTIFDSLAAIHSDHPDTAILRRLHPEADPIQYVEGPRIELMTGDSLFRRVCALHAPVHAMHQRFTNRIALVLDSDHASIAALETVEWRDDDGSHRYDGVLTLAITRRGQGWVIRAYHGT